MKHVRRVAFICLMLSGLMTAMLSGCGGNNPPEEQGESMPVGQAEDELGDEE